MKKNRFLSILLLLSLILALLAPAVLAEGETESQQEPTQTAEQQQDSSADSETGAAADGGVSPGDSYAVNAKASMLIELNTDTVLLEQNADEKIYPASLTKIMTCLLAIENGNLSDQITVSATALQGLDEAGSTAGLVEGETLTLEEILYCMMLSSANEACNVVAEYVSGSVDAFVERMNQKAEELGCTGTHFANPHGLHDDDHYTTARDLSIITEAALQNETFRTITSTTTYDVPATNKSEVRHLVTTNFLISRDTTSNYYYEYATGVKTGYTSQAGRCLISTADNGKLKLLSIVCGAETKQLENGDLELENFVETKKLLEYGFDHWAYAKVLSTLYPIAQIPVLDSAGADAAVLSPDAEITALLPADFEESQIVTDIKLVNENGVEAPITKGQSLGTVTVSYQGKQLGTANLVAITDIARSEIAAEATSTKSFLSEHWLKLLIGAFVFLLIVYNIVTAVNRARRRRYRRKRREQMKRSGHEPIRFPGTREEYDDDED